MPGEKIHIVICRQFAVYLANIGKLDNNQEDWRAICYKYLESSKVLFPHWWIWSPGSWKSFQKVLDTVLTSVFRELLVSEYPECDQCIQFMHVLNNAELIVLFRYFCHILSWYVCQIWQGFLQLGTPQKHSNLDALDLFTFYYYRNPWFGCRNLYTHFSISKAVHNLVYFLATGKFIAGPWSSCFSFSLWKKLSALLFRQPASKTHRLSQICHRSIPSRNFAPCKNTHVHPFSIITPAKIKVFSSQPNPTHQRLGMFMFTTAPSLLRAVNFLRQQTKGRDTPRTWMAYGYQTMHACIMRMEWDTGILSWLLMGSTIYIICIYIYIFIQYISYNIHSYTFIYIISTPNRWRTADWFGSVSNILKLLKSSAIDRNSNRFPFPSFTLCRPGAHVLPRAPNIFRSSPCSWNWPPYVSWRPPWSVCVVQKSILELSTFQPAHGEQHWVVQCEGCCRCFLTHCWASADKK